MESGMKLLPLEFCNLKRAAKMLLCEVEDFIHWADIGAVKLCIKLHSHHSFIILRSLDDEEPLKKLTSLMNNHGELSIGYKKTNTTFTPEGECFNLINSDDRLVAAYGIADGLWSINQRMLRNIELKGSSLIEGLLRPDEHNTIANKLNVLSYLMRIRPFEFQFADILKKSDYNFSRKKPRLMTT